MFIPINDMARILRLRVDGRLSTSFVVLRDSRQYLVTTKHAVESLQGMGGFVELHVHGQWRSLEARVVGQGTDEVDIAVLVFKKALPISPSAAEISMEGLMMGHEVRFVGFPLDLAGDFGHIMQYSPVPFVKHGIISCLVEDKFAIDGNNVSGLSGSPVYFSDQRAEGRLEICAVIAGYRHQGAPVVNADGDHTGHFVKMNTGIIWAFGIHHVINIIDSCPEGLHIFRDVSEMLGDDHKASELYEFTRNLIMNLPNIWGVNDELVATMFALPEEARLDSTFVSKISAFEAGVITRAFLIASINQTLQEVCITEDRLQSLIRMPINDSFFQGQNILTKAQGEIDSLRYILSYVRTLQEK